MMEDFTGPKGPQPPTPVWRSSPPTVLRYMKMT